MNLTSKPSLPSAFALVARTGLAAGLLGACHVVALAQAVQPVAAAPASAASSAPATAALPDATNVEGSQDTSTPDIANGQATQAWLGAQASRKQASRTRQTQSGTVMSKVHERYVKSFERPIPDRLRDDTGFGSGSK